MKTIESVVVLTIDAGQHIADCLDDQSRKTNSLYNRLLEKAQEHQQAYYDGIRKHSDLLFSKYGLRNLVPGIKEEYPYLKSVHSSPLKNAALRATSAIKAFFDSRCGRQKGKKVGWPHFSSWKQHWFSLLYDEPKKGFKIKNGCLHLSLGTGSHGKRHTLILPLHGTHALKGKTIRNLRIIKVHGIFKAVFTVFRLVPEQKPVQRIIALDPNHKNFAYGVNNKGQAIKIDAPTFLKALDRRFDELRSRLDRCTKKSKQIVYTDKEGRDHSYWVGSRKYQKIEHTLNKLLAKRRELTKVFCYRVAHWLCKQYDLIGIGDYAPQGQGLHRGMRRAMNNRSLIGTFKKTLTWTAAKSGKMAYIYDETGTTRTCHFCAYVVENGITPSIRSWQCEGCKNIHDRDENAAFNGLKKVYEEYKKISRDNSLPVPRSGLVHSVEQWTCRVAAGGVITTKRQQQHSAAPASN